MTVTPRSKVTSYGSSLDSNIWPVIGGVQQDPLYPPTWSSNGYKVERLIVSDSHRRPYTRGGGGPFYQTTYEERRFAVPNAFMADIYPGYQQYSAGVFPTAGTESKLPDGPFAAWNSVQADLTGWGAKGWNRARPLKPPLNLGQFLGELRQLPAVPLRAVAKAVASGGGPTALRRAVGSEYLNYDFGWKPFIKDLVSFLDFNQTLDKATREAYQNNGQSQRRKRILVDRTDVDVTEDESGYYGYYAIPGSYKTFRTVITTTHTKIWFVGRFRYHIPGANTPQGVAALRRYLSGSRIDLSLVWELTPWSWMVDWFTNVGDVLANYASQGAINMVADYAYVMRQETIERWSVHSALSSYGPVRDLVWYSKRETKARMEASPFGFGTTFDQLSGSQVATLAALGLNSKMF